MTDLTQDKTPTPKSTSIAHKWKAATQSIGCGIAATIVIEGGLALAQIEGITNFKSPLWGSLTGLDAGSLYAIAKLTLATGIITAASTTAAAYALQRAKHQLLAIAVAPLFICAQTTFLDTHGHVARLPYIPEDNNPQSSPHRPIMVMNEVKPPRRVLAA